MSLSWPLSTAGVTLLVFTVSWMTASALMAVVMALAAMTACAVLLMLVFGTGRLRRSSRPAPALWRSR